MSASAPRTTAKQGLGSSEDAVKRHAERAFSVRKDKRAEKLNQRRRITASDGEVGATEWTAACARYTASTTIEERLVKLTHIMILGTNDQLETFITDHILRSDTIASLIDLMATHPLLAYRICAIKCLVNLVGAETSHILACAVLMVDGGVLASAAAVLRDPPPHSSDNAKDRSLYLQCMWECVLNLACSCPEGRDAVLSSPLFVNAPTPLPPRSPPPFIVALSTGSTAPAELMLALLDTIVSSGNTLPPEPLLMTVWPILCEALTQHVLPEPARQEGTNVLLDYLLSVLSIVARRSGERFFAQLLMVGGDGQSHTSAPLLVWFTRLLPRLTLTPPKNRERAAIILVSAGRIAVEGATFQQIMASAGAIPAMVRLANDANEALRREGTTWIANYASEGVAYVEQLLECGAFDPIVACIRGSHQRDSPVTRQSIFALVTACYSCIRERGERADDILGQLVVSKHVVRYTRPFVDMVGCDDMTVDVLTLWHSLLVWNTAVITPLLEECGAMERVSILLGHRNMRIFKLAEAIEERVERADGMDVDHEAVEQPPPVMVAPGTWRGGFNF